MLATSPSIDPLMLYIKDEQIPPWLDCPPLILQPHCQLWFFECDGMEEHNLSKVIFEAKCDKSLLYLLIPGNLC